MTLESLPDLIAAATKPNCEVCLGGGWVCEEHPARPWETGSVDDCGCGAPGQPCACTGMDGPQP